MRQGVLNGQALLRMSPCRHGSDEDRSLSEILGSESSVSHDLPQQALAKVPAAMDGHGCASAIRVLQQNVTPGLAHLRETVRFQHAQKLLRSDGRETLTQTATRTFVIPCSR